MSDAVTRTVRNKYLLLTRNYTTTKGMTLQQVREMIEKFKNVGGTVVRDAGRDAFILIDDFIPPEKMDEALDIFEGHELETIDVDILSPAHPLKQRQRA